jgi:hypothetical protein
MMRNECLSAALQELSAAGIRDVKQAYGGKHLQLRWEAVNGAGQRMYSLPLTPSDIRSAANTRADVRRILREDGMLMTAEPRTPAPKPPDRVTLLQRQVTDMQQRLSALEQQIIKERMP